MSRLVVGYFGPRHKFSSMYPTNVGGLPSAEHYYQWRKARYFEDARLAEQIAQTGSPFTVKQLGQQVAGFDPVEWYDEGAAEQAMWSAMRLKYLSSELLTRALLRTGDALLVEASPHDRFWGAGRAQRVVELGLAFPGENRHGELTMQLRDQIQRRRATRLLQAYPPAYIKNQKDWDR